MAAPTGSEWTVKVAARSRRISLRVYPGGRVTVTVPPGTPPLTVERFVSKHRVWIDTQVAQMKLRVAPTSDAAPQTIALTCFNESWAVSYQSNKRAGWDSPQPGHLTVFADSLATPQWRDALRAWLLAQAQQRLAPWLAAVANERGFHYQRAQIRRQRTRWGSCSKSGTISLNVCLLFQPPAVVRYLLIHELAHTVQMNHSARFWQLVESHEPQWRELDKLLLKGWQNVPGWVYV